ncbi:hypothetical protein BJY52DRAFT_1392353 [Lactarius psammicola]|nr:hypothetical protein BJY52DRAFT_1392353 [Lactarius psammicola]
MMAADAEGEQHYGPRSHIGPDDDDFYLNFLRQVTHFPDDYHHGPSAAVNTFPPIQDSLPLSCPLDPIAELPIFERRLSLGLSRYHQDLLEGAHFAKGPSPHYPLKPFCNADDLLLTTMALGPSAELSLFADDQHGFSWGPPQAPLLDQSNQLYHLSFPVFPQESPQSSGANLTPESGGITGPTSEPSSLPNLDIFPCSPVSERVYQEAERVCNSGLFQASMAAIQESPIDPTTANVHINEGSMYPPATSHQALCGYVDGFAGMSMNGHGSSLPYSGHQIEETASPNFQSAIQASHPAIVASSIASNQVTPVDELSRTFWCHICGVGFVQRQGFNRHNRDKHTPRNICPLCERYEWSSGRRYLFLRHLERHHPGVVLV